MASCAARCRAAPGCAASTYHRQGAAALGGRAARPGPCVLHSSCRARDTRSCPACVTTILACTQRGEEEVEVEVEGEVEGEVEQEAGGGLLLLGGFALRHVRHVESVGCAAQVSSHWPSPVT